MSFAPGVFRVHTHNKAPVWANCIDAGYRRLNSSVQIPNGQLLYILDQETSHTYIALYDGYLVVVPCSHSLSDLFMELSSASQD